MVVHEDSEKPLEVPVVRNPLMEQKSYVIVKNHVRELVIDNSKSSSTINKETSPENIGKQTQKSKKKLKNNAQILATTTENEDDTIPETNIDEDDLQELREVYKKCKKVIKKIESKYGHLLDLDSEAGPSTYKKQKSNIKESSNMECNCQLNTKIVFGDDGNQSTVEIVSEKHICTKKMKIPPSSMQTRSKNIAIEYTDTEIILPNSLQELYSLLQDPDIEKPFRNKIIDKIKMIKQEYVNEIKFNKYAIIEQLKSNPDEVLGFKGTNLAKIPGYS